MNFTLTNTLFAALLATLTVGARAQNIHGGVQQDPNATTATYTIDIQGPANGVGFTLVSPLLGQPIWFPGIQNALLIDPLLGAPLHLVPLDPFGRGLDQLVVPMPIANGLTLAMQAVIINPAGQAVFAPPVGAVPFAAPPAGPAAPPRVQFNGSFNGPNYTLQMLSGPPGANVRVLVNGGQKATGYLITDGNGRGSVTVPIPGGVQPGDRVTIEVNGVPVSQRW